MTLYSTRISAQVEEPLEDFCASETVITYDLEGEDCPAEPYSWGGSRGREIEMSAEIVNVRIGALDLSRDQFIAACTDDQTNGARFAASLEEAAATRAAERYQFGELA